MPYAKRTLSTLIIAFAAVALAAQTSSMQDLLYPNDTKKIILPGGTEIAYLDRGQGPYTLLFVHGLGSHLKSWQHNVNVLSIENRCIALDLPGYGKSSKGDYPISMTYFAEQIIQFCKALELESVILVGHSMGGQIALTLALQDSTLLKKLVLVAPAGIETFTEAEANWLKSAYTPEVLKNASQDQTQKDFEANFYIWPYDAEYMFRERLFMRETTEYEGWCRMIPKCVAAMLDEPVFGRLEKIAIPTLIIFGENDALIPNTFLHKNLNTKQIAQLAQSKIPGSRLRLLPQAGHFVQWEQATLTNQAIREFVEE